MWSKFFRLSFLFMFVTGCAGFQRDCSSSCNSELGADWIIVQYKYDGVPMNCWKLHDAAVSNETGTDGIYWQYEGHLVHVSGWYNRVQVAHAQWKQAATTLGVDDDKCGNGIYPTK